MSPLLRCLAPLLVLAAWGSAGAEQVSFALPDLRDYTMPPSGQVTVAAEGGLTFQMKINGLGPFATVFDTGGVNIINVSFAKQLGLKVEETAIDFGAIGGTVKVHVAHVDTLTIGGLIVRDQLFYVLDIPSDEGEPLVSVGWELMQRFAVRVNFEKNELTFFDGESFRYTGHGEKVPLLLHKDGNGIDIEANVDGIRGRFLVDSGNQTGLFLNAGFVNKNNLVQMLGARYRGYNGKGFGGPSPEAWYVRLHTFQIGKLKTKGPMARLQTASDSMNETLAGNIGQNILNRFIVTVDCRRHVMYLEKTAAWSQPEAFNRAGMIVDYNQGADEVKTVFPGSAAESAGVQLGDRVVAINGNKPANDPNDPVFKQPAGTVLHLAVRRGEATRVLDITLRDVF